jgi:hypothetical protein
MVNLFVAVFLSGSVVSVIAQRDFWPFSHYPMFAALQPPEVQVLEVVGIRAGDSVEVPLAPSRRTSIVAGARYRMTLVRLLEHGSELELQDYLKDAARRYERARSDQKPTLQAVRLYKTQWKAVANESPPVRRIGRQLLLELTLSR